MGNGYIDGSKGLNSMVYSVQIIVYILMIAKIDPHVNCLTKTKGGKDPPLCFMSLWAPCILVVTIYKCDVVNLCANVSIVSSLDHYYLNFQIYQ